MAERSGKTHDPSAKIVRQLLTLAAACICALVVVAVCAILSVEGTGEAAQLRDQVVSLNALAQQGVVSDGGQAIAQAQDALRAAADAKDATTISWILIMLAGGVVCVIIIGAYLYVSVIRPFMRLQEFAGNIAEGDLDFPLAYERSNPFGRFAWAFDHMRSEIKRARAAERAAIEGNKTVMASLAHDVRTPVASARAYAEAIELGIPETSDERIAYTRVIERKCDEVARLVDDMLVHALAELEGISIERAPVSAVPLIRNAAEGFGVADIEIPHVDEATILVDDMRLSQVLENLFVNAVKYAPEAKIHVSGRICADTYRIEVRDFGPGMDPEDIPFACERFYRGKNAQVVEGAGLGLFVVKHVVERMGGAVLLHNAHPGLAVTIEIPIG